MFAILTILRYISGHIMVNGDSFRRDTVPICMYTEKELNLQKNNLIIVSIPKCILFVFTAFKMNFYAKRFHKFPKMPRAANF